MPSDETYGSRFLNALDASLSYKLLRYAEREEMRRMERDDVITKLKLNRHSAFRGIAELPAEDAGRRFGEQLLKAQQMSDAGLEAGMGLAEIALLVNLL